MTEVIGVLQGATASRAKSVVSRHARTLFDFFIQAFDVRHACTSKSGATYSEEQVSAVESATIEALISTVFKINDTTFRPFFVRLLEQCTWIGEERATSKQQRTMTFFHFVNALSTRLKSIFTNYFGLLLEPMTAMLRAEAGSDGSMQMVQCAILEALSSSFAHDQEGKAVLRVDVQRNEANIAVQTSGKHRRTFPRFWSHSWAN